MPKAKNTKPKNKECRFSVEATICVTLVVGARVSKLEARRRAAKLVAREIGDGLSLQFFDEGHDPRLYMKHDGKSVRGVILENIIEVEAGDEDVDEDWDED